MLKNPSVRLAAAMWLLAMCGVAVLAFTVLPQLLAKSAGKLAPGVAMTAAVLQSTILVLLAVWTGVALSKPLGLGAPVIEAALSGSAIWPALRRQLLPATVVGLLCGAVVLLVARRAPAELLAAGGTLELPLAARVLYGGVTEEVLLRWGVLTLLMWLPWRLLQKKGGRPHLACAAGAILVAGVLFGLAHLPAATSMGIKLTVPVVTFIIVGNAIPGILFGWLYWRRGIEAAMIGHALSHVVAVGFSFL